MYPPIGRLCLHPPAETLNTRPLVLIFMAPPLEEGGGAGRGVCVGGGGVNGPSYYVVDTEAFKGRRAIRRGKGSCRVLGGWLGTRVWYGSRRTGVRGRKGTEQRQCGRFDGEMHTHTRAKRRTKQKENPTNPQTHHHLALAFFFFLFSFRLGCCHSCFLLSFCLSFRFMPPPTHYHPQPTPTPSSARAKPTWSGPEATCGQGVSGGGSS